jgi:hypothetical protein
MYDTMLEEMADELARELRLDNAAALRVLSAYWRDKIAHVWQVSDLLEAALQAGQPITQADAQDLLQDIFASHDSSLGITWTTLECALQDYHLDFASLAEGKYAEVYGVFKVWREQSAVAHQFGFHPGKTAGNLPAALACARSLAAETPGQTILLACESEAGAPWLFIRQDESGAIQITPTREYEHESMD